MSKPMLTESDWSRNVGTQSFPVSFLHEYAVGLLWDRLHGNDPVIVTTMYGRTSTNLKDGTDRVVIPDSMQPIGGCIPDLALLDENLRPVRVVEVVVTSPPTGEKMEKLKRLEERGVEVVLVPVRNEVELKALVPTETDGKRINWAYSWSPWVFEQVGIINFPRMSSIRIAQGTADAKVGELINAIVQCDPETRRRLGRLLDELGSLEAAYPLSPKNPKRTNLTSNGGNE